MRRHRVRVISTGVCDSTDALTVFDDVFLRMSTMDSVDGFGQLFATSLKNARNNLLRDTLRRVSRFCLTVDEDDGGTPIPPQASEDFADTQVLKKEDDQSQLIAYLSDPTQVDSDTTAIVSTFLQDEYESVRALAKALGLHPEAVNRKLRKLGHRYDANRFGNISDYLPEGLRVNRKYISA
ncbi:hypothetical protein [Paenibacillus polymyxa]|uniref:hypothetical protein n=1 Tax=Paenibacillus polymyxa TaxID=1406 RepID=UPI0018B0A812|nr:hypothetical protein [Paenibacillus polymyxa]